MGFQYAHESDDPRAGLFEVVVRVRHETPKALLVHDGTIEAWVPKSKVKRELNRDGTLTLYLPEWLAKEKRFV